MQEEFSFAKRTNWELLSNRLMTHLHDMRHEGVQIIDLTESNPTRCRFHYPKEKILSALGDPTNMIYDPSPAGSLDAREAIADYYQNKGFGVSPHQIFLTASTSEAYTFLFRLLANPGERILFPRPSYPLFEFLVDLNDIKMDVYPILYQEDEEQKRGFWAIDFETLEGEIQSTTRGIVIVNPNNPTGSFIREGELHQVNKICQKNNLAIIDDEVFLDYRFQEEYKPLSFVVNCEVLTFVMGGLSKTLGLPQMKLSWIVVNGPEDLVRTVTERLEIILDTYLSVNIPAQNALKNWLAWQPQMNMEILTRLKANHKFLVETLMEIPECKLLPIQGGWYAILKLPPTQKEEEWVMDFLTKDHVFVHPGYFFDFYEEPRIVLSLLPPEEQFQEAVNRILKRITLNVSA